MMAFIQTYLFLDLETTGLPQEEFNKTKITEISLIGVKRNHLLDTRIGASPRVQQKLTLCFNPGRLIQPGCSKVTGLCNDLLEHESYFDIDAFTIINKFISVLTKPVCLVAQNGMNFDYPILKGHLVKLGVSFQEDLLCADCYHAFYDILEQKNSKTNVAIPEQVPDLDEQSQFNLESLSSSVSQVDFAKEIQKKNETTPKKSTTQLNIPAHQKPSKCIKNGNSIVRRKFPWSLGDKPTKKYKLKDIYERVLNRPAIEAHRAENDCLLALEVSVALQKDFVKWVDNNYCSFSEVKAMTVGVPLGE